MIIELLIGAGLVAAGVTTARILIRHREEIEDAEGREGGPPRKDPEARRPKKDAKPAAKGPDADPGPKRRRARRKAPKRVGPRGLLVGDVLLYADTELWLAGLIELDEEGLVARLFPTPGALRSEWVAQLDEEARDLATLSETDEVPAGAVPESLPIGGRRLTLERRGTADVRTEGEHLPRVTGRGTYTLLSDAGGRVLFVLDFDKAPRIALVGDRVAKHMVDLLPGGDLDDEDDA